jgi:hypothetical protein
MSDRRKAAPTAEVRRVHPRVMATRLTGKGLRFAGASSPSRRARRRARYIQ